MCRQAENWHLKLDADISELENRDLLDKIQRFEERQFVLKKDKPNIKLESLSQGAGVAPLLKAEIDK